MVLLGLLEDLVADLVENMDLLKEKRWSFSQRVQQPRLAATQPGRLDPGGQIAAPIWPPSPAPTRGSSLRLEAGLDSCPHAAQQRTSGLTFQRLKRGFSRFLSNRLRLWKLLSPGAAGLPPASVSSPGSPSPPSGHTPAAPPPRRPTSGTHTDILSPVG